MDKYFLNPIANNNKFPLIVVGGPPRKSSVTNIIHWHDEIEIAYMDSGSAPYHIGGELVNLETNQMIFVNSGELHRGIDKWIYGCTAYAIVFKLDLLSHFLNDKTYFDIIEPIADRQRKLPRLITGSCQWERKVFEHAGNIIKTYLSKPFGYEFSIMSSLYAMFYTILENGKLEEAIEPKNNCRDKKLTYIANAMQYIQHHYYSDIEVKVIANHLGINRTYFSEVFKAVTGYSPIDYINMYRIEKAAGLLCETNKKILDIALETGFDNISYFNKMFKKHKKCTPGEFRQYR